MKEKSRASEHLVILLVIALALAGLVTFSFNTSVLFGERYIELNGSDAIENLVAAKAWAKKGMLPYRDLYTTGGLTIYAMMASGYFVSGVYGVLGVQLICMLVSFLILCRLMRGCRFIVKLFAMLIFSFICVSAYSAGAGSVEFVMPFLLYAVWYVFGSGIKTDAELQRSGFLRNVGMLITGVALVFSHVAFGVLAVFAVLCGRKTIRSKQSKIGVLLGIITGTAVILGVLYMNGMLTPWFNMISEYYVPSALDQFQFDLVFEHRLIKCLPILIILMAVLYANGRGKKWFLFISCLMILVYLWSGDDAWFRYGVLAAFVPPCFIELGHYTEQKHAALILVVTFASFLLIGILVFPLKYTAVNFIDEMNAGKAAQETVYIKSYEQDDYSDEMLCLDASAKFYLILDKYPVNRYYTKQSEVAEHCQPIADYLYEYGWSEEFKGDILIYGSKSGWLYESIGKYQMVDLLSFQGKYGVYLWTETSGGHVHDGSVDLN